MTMGPCAFFSELQAPLNRSMKLGRYMAASPAASRNQGSRRGGVNAAPGALSGGEIEPAISGEVRSC